MTKIHSQPVALRPPVFQRITKQAGFAGTPFVITRRHDFSVGQETV